MAEATFDEFLEWLQERVGSRVYLEVGTKAPDLEFQADAFPVALHVVIKGIQPATNTDRPEKMSVMVDLEGEGNRLYLEPDRITEINIHGPAVKLRYLDRFYVALSGVPS